MSFWGYGGTACHPVSQVQPFARLCLKETGSIGLIMEPINSNAGSEEIVAKQFSDDGIHWMDIPSGIRVTGSRYALVLSSIQPADLEVDIAEYEVGVGPSRGKSAESYLRGRIDKACLVRSKDVKQGMQKRIHKVEFVANLTDPFAVLLR